MNYLSWYDNPLSKHLHFLFTMNAFYFHHCSHDDLRKKKKWVSQKLIKQGLEELKEKFNTAYIDIELLIQTLSKNKLQI